MNKFYITTPIYYVNSHPHLGHLYTTLIADTITRYKRQRGVDTFFLTGTDEHGINIERAAQKAGRTPQQQADYVVDYFKQMTREFGLDTEHGGYDIFMRTTAPFHYEGVSELWRRIVKTKTPKGNDAIYKGHYEGWFCAPCAAYKTEDEYNKPASPDGVVPSPAADSAAGVAPCFFAAALAFASCARLRRCSGISVMTLLRSQARSAASTQAPECRVLLRLAAAQPESRIEPHHSGPEMPPSLRTRQKWIAMKITVMNGTKSTCSVYQRSSVSLPISTPPSSTKRTWSPKTGV